VKLTCVTAHSVASRGEARRRAGHCSGDLALPTIESRRWRAGRPRVDRSVSADRQSQADGRQAVDLPWRGIRSRIQLAGGSASDNPVKLPAAALSRPLAVDDSATGTTLEAAPSPKADILP
jgi:hypothetical protein